MSEQKSAIQSVLEGDVAGNSTPLHPALVHFPLVLYPLSAIMRALGYFELVSIPGTFQWAHYMNIAAILWTIPTAITGLAEYRNIPSTAADAHSTVTKHILLNTLVTAIGVYNWYSIRNQPGYQPSKLNVILGLVGVALIIGSGHLGGKLVYKHGLGVQRQGF